MSFFVFCANYFRGGASFFEISEAVAHSERRAADKVPERHRREVFKTAGERQRCFHAVLRRGKRTGGQVVQVRDAVLIAAEDKEQDGKKERDDLPLRAFGGCRHPHREANQKIAQDPAQESVSKSERRLALRDGDHRARQTIAEKRGRVAVDRQRGHRRAAHGIAKVDSQPVTQQLCGRDAALQQGHHHQAVAGEKLAAREDHHGKSRRKHAGRKELCKRAALHRHGGRRRTDARERDVGSRQYGEQEHLSKGQPRLAFAGGEQAPGDLGRGEHGQISFSLSCGFMRTQY